MTFITIVIESTLSGPIGGFHGVKIDDSQTVGQLVHQFCRAKGAAFDRNYSLITNNNVMLVSDQPISNFSVTDGQLLKLVQRPRSYSKLLFRQWLSMAAIALFVAVVGQITITLLYAVYGNYPNNYAMVISAGPYQSDLTLYSWSGNKVGNTGEIMEISKCSAMGNIADVSNMAEYFDPCFKTLYDNVLPDSQKTAEVLFGSTTEMRMTYQMNNTKTEEILSNVLTYLENYNWEYKSSNIRSLVGSEEGVNQWISTNFLEQKLYERGWWNETLGTFGLEDSSTFVSFEVPETLRNLPNVYPASLFGNDFFVLSESYVCYGVVEALRRYRTILLIAHLESGNSQENVASPCEPLDWNFKSSSTYFSSICVPENLSESEKSWNFVGSGNYNECQHVVSKLLNYSECVRSKLGNCLDTSQIPIDMENYRFHALSTFSSTAQSLGIPPGSTLYEAHRHVRVMCDYPTDTKKLREGRAGEFESLCFEGQYMFALLTEVYGLDSESKWSQIKFTTEGEGWSVGYMINATNNIDPVPRVPKVKTVAFTLLTILFIIFFALSIGFIMHGMKLKNGSQGYERF